MHPTQPHQQHLRQDSCEAEVLILKNDSTDQTDIISTQRSQEPNLEAPYATNTDQKIGNMFLTYKKQIPKQQVLQQRQYNFLSPLHARSNQQRRQKGIKIQTTVTNPISTPAAFETTNNTQSIVINRIMNPYNNQVLMDAQAI